MKLTRTLLVFIAAVLVAAPVARALTPAPLWHDLMGDASQQYVYDIAIDPNDGDVAIVGTFAGTMLFDGLIRTSVGGFDGFIAVYNANGFPREFRQFGDTSNQYAQCVAFAPDGDLFVGGYISGVANLGGTSLTSAGGADIVLAHYTDDLAHVWSKRFGDASSQYAIEMDVNTAGDVWLCGYFAGTVAFGGTLTSAGGNDAYIARFNGLGTHQFSARFGDTATQYGNSIAVDGADNVYLTGLVSGSINLGGAVLTSAGSNDAYLAKFNAAGVHQWSKIFGDTGNQFAQEVSVTASGLCCITGSFGGTINFGGSALTSTGSDDIFLACFNTGGFHQWSKRFGDASQQSGISVSAGDAGVYITGNIQGSADFGGGALTSVGQRDLYLARFTTLGAHVSSALYGDATSQYGTGVDQAPGRVVLGAYFEGTMNMGVIGNATSLGATDAYAACFSTNSAEPVITSITDVPDDQGRRVRVHFDRSGYDDPVSAGRQIASYEAFLYRELNRATASGPLLTFDTLAEVWVYTGSIPAHGSDHYMMIVPTFYDSTKANGDYNSQFYISAVTTNAIETLESPVAEGSSTDNLAPPVPSPLTFDTQTLRWTPSPHEDLRYYSVFASASPVFDVGAVLVDYVNDPEYTPSPGLPAYFYVTATDHSGNESGPAKLRVLTGSGGTPVSRVLSLSAYPNPFNPATTLRYTLPTSARVRISVYDARGAHVTTILDEERTAGAYTARWDGRDSGGSPAGSGVYFARIEAGAETRSYKLVLVK